MGGGEVPLRRGDKRGVAAGAGGFPCGDFLLFRDVQRGVFGFDRAEGGAVLAGGVAFPLDAVVENGRGLELVEHEHQRAEQQDEELHRNFEQSVEHEAEAALAQRRAAEVALHLRLVGAEIRERQEQAAEEAAPERVACVGVEGEVDRLEFPECAREFERVRGQARDEDGEGRDHAAEDDAHLPFLREVHGRAAAGDGVDNHDDADDEDQHFQRPAEHGGENDGRCVDRDAGLHAALQEKENGAEDARLFVEAITEVFVGGVNAELAVDRQKHGAYNDEREGQTEIVLHETDAAFETLAGDGEKRDRAGLRGRDGDTDREPTRVAVALEVSVEVIGVTRAPRAVSGDAHHGADEDDPIEQRHE